MTAPYQRVYYSCDVVVFFFFNDTATTEIYTLSLHDALPICSRRSGGRTSTLTGWRVISPNAFTCMTKPAGSFSAQDRKSTTSELQSQSNIVCRLLLEKKLN